jgi:hypothetical protein
MVLQVLSCLRNISTVSLSSAFIRNAFQSSLALLQGHQAGGFVASRTNKTGLATDDRASLDENSLGVDIKITESYCH